MSSSTSTTERHYFFSRVLQREKLEPLPGREDRLLISFYLVKQSRCWYDHPWDFTYANSAAAQTGVMIYYRRREDYITSFARDLWTMDVPEEEMPTILKKISEVLQAAIPHRRILVMMADVTVRLLGSFDDRDAIENFIRASPDINVPMRFSITGDLGFETHTLSDVDYHGNTVADGLTLEIARLTLESFQTQRFRFVPATRSAIESLHKVRLDSLEKASMELNPSCSICYDDFAEDGVDQLVIPLPCAHHYHADCIIHWLERSHLCPLCRYALPTVEEGKPSNS
ncbi:hypothetical protein M0R45_033619 [Rubus argutus]|uniref:RING-type E3 ubiquitin transferase n=1 Tax=Rubus argutus TaxID=59490 RepID=A0AAW1WKI2_RUBAR